MRMPPRRAARVAAALCCVTLASCDRPVKEQLYFPELKPPAGVKVNVVSDVSRNAAQQTSSTMVVAVDPNLDRDELDRLLRSFIGQMEERTQFRRGRADRLELRVYASEAAAKAGQQDWLGQGLRASLDGKPTFTNRQKLPLLKWAEQALGKQPQFTGALKPRILADPTALELEIVVPFVRDDLSGKYVETLSYTTATTTFSSYTRTLFDKIAELKKLTFVGRHNDQQVMKIWLTREQYDALSLRQVEESLGAFQGKFLAALMTKSTTSQAVERKVAAQRRKVYRETLARLPKAQVELAKALR